MFSYIMLGTNDLPRAIKFYDPLMALLGHVKAGRNEQGASWGTFNGNHTCGLCVGVPFDQQPAGVGNGTMVALNARSVAHIAELHALALQLGGRDEGGPGHRPQYGDGFHSATSAIPTAISWRLFTMRLQIEWLQRRWLLQAEKRESGRPTSPSLFTEG
ncbi:Lactoylglutathione lyase [Klebsiella pneumoniae]|uniref:Lactoylglutathione lyase n=2 Tax=Klebsiella pneumoniae TaxID=573 RepID=A0A377WND5_KLEPN|nr:Lactoylglutathione lyase [Klebsiella pneumoniae]